MEKAEEFISSDKIENLLVLLGNTGAGKSTLGNSLSGKPQLFESNGGSESFTSEVFFKKTQWNPVSKAAAAADTSQVLNLCDTPGMFDSRKQDYKNMTSLVNYFSEHVGSISALLIVLNGQLHRLDVHLKEMIDLFSKVFPNMWENTMVVFTRWGQDKRSQEVREKTGETDEKKTQQYNKYLKDTYGLKHDVPIVFIDNYPAKDPEEQKHFASAISQIRNFVGSVKKPFDVQRVKAGALEAMQPSKSDKGEELARKNEERKAIEQEIKALQEEQKY